MMYVVMSGDGPRLLDDLKLIFDGQRYNAMDARYRSFGNAMQSGHGPKSDWCVHRVDNQTGDSLPRLDRR
jgi:hypothetical protein